MNSFLCTKYKLLADRSEKVGINIHNGVFNIAMLHVRLTHAKGEYLKVRFINTCSKAYQIVKL